MVWWTVILWISAFQARLSHGPIKERSHIRSDAGWMGFAVIVIGEASLMRPVYNICPFPDRITYLFLSEL